MTPDQNQVDGQIKVKMEVPRRDKDTGIGEEITGAIVENNKVYLLCTKWVSRNTGLCYRLEITGDLARAFKNIYEDGYKQGKWDKQDEIKRVLGV